MAFGYIIHRAMNYQKWTWIHWNNSNFQSCGNERPFNRDNILTYLYIYVSFFFFWTIWRGVKQTWILLSLNSRKSRRLGTVSASSLSLSGLSREFMYASTKPSLLTDKFPLGSEPKDSGSFWQCRFLTSGIPANHSAQLNFIFICYTKEKWMFAICSFSLLWGSNWLASWN